MRLFIRSKKGYIWGVEIQKLMPGAKISESRAWRPCQSGRFI
jgi:hypothetical protein